MRSTYHIIDTTIAIRIGFELPGYTYTEPQFDELIDQTYVSPTGRPENGPVFLLKEDNVISEQTFLVSFQVTDSAHFGTQSAAAIDQDYRFAGPGLISATEFFSPPNREFLFRLSCVLILSLKQLKHFRLMYLQKVLETLVVG